MQTSKYILNIRKDMDDHERLYNITLSHKLKEWNSTFIAVLHFTVTVGSSAIRITESVTLKWV